MSDLHNPDVCGGEEVSVIDEPQVKEPPRYAVYLHNDDYTTMDFVVRILREVAETKVWQVRTRAREAGFPLRCTMEQE